MKPKQSQTISAAATPKTPQPRVVISSSQKAMRVPRRRLAELIAFVACAEGVRLAEVDLALVGGREIAGLNRRWLGHVGATDVLSFDMTDDASRKGERAAGAGLAVQLIICTDVAVQQGKARGIAPQRELMLYVVHGLLHMMGYDDKAVRCAAAMHAREEEILREFLRL